MLSGWWDYIFELILVDSYNMKLSYNVQGLVLPTLELDLTAFSGSFM